MKRQKISLIGGGQIGGNLALIAAQKELGDIVIYDIPNAEGMIKGKALDISQLTPLDGYDTNISGSSNPEDLKGKTVGVWFGGNEYPLMNWMSKLNIPIDGSAGGVTLMKQGYNVDPLLQKQADCVSAMAYNEYWQVIDAGLTNDDLTIFNYTDLGVASLEDGLYVLEDNLRDPNFVTKMAKFVRASMKGWAWARENNDAAADIVLGNDDTGAQTEAHQRRMMGEINKLTAGSDGSLVEADFNTTVENLMSAGADAVISKKPVGAWSHVITDQM